MSTTERLNWGILGTGNIAGKFAAQLPDSKTGRLYAVGSRSADAAAKFAAAHDMPVAHGSYQDLLDDPDVEAVYISLPNHIHAEWTERCARAGKHILCEKPFTLTHAEAVSTIDEIRRCGVFLMEAFMYRCHPVIADMTRRIRGGELGRICLVEARFSGRGQPAPNKFRWQNACGGGSILDLGGYCMSMARLLAGAALGQAVPVEPIDIKGAGYVGEYEVDEWAAATLRFDNDILSLLYASQRFSGGSFVRVYGDRGQISTGIPWFPGRNGEPAAYTLTLEGEDAREISVSADVPLYAIEADVLAAHREAKQAPYPCMTWSDTLANMAALDSWRAEIGLTFEAER